jgi:hypothetical protein
MLVTAGISYLLGCLALRPGCEEVLDTDSEVALDSGFASSWCRSGGLDALFDTLGQG